MNNRVGAAFLLTFLVVSSLLGMYFLPEMRVGDWTLRKVDLLSDLRASSLDDSTKASDTASIVLPEKEKLPFVDSCRAGLTCIIDYSDASSASGMRHFYQSLSDINKLDRPLRIAYLGDSYIEGDILTGYLREYLQERYGGRGVGWVSITSQTAGFRPTVQHRFSGWESHSVTDSCCFSLKDQDLSNRYFIPKEHAWVELKGITKGYTTVDSATRSLCYLETDKPLELTALVDGAREKHFQLEGDSLMQAIAMDGEMERIRWSVSKLQGRSLFYGVSMETPKGVILDNFSLRGSSGIQLKGIPLKRLRALAHLRPYDLIVLHYGPNIASKKAKNYTYYTRGMLPVIEQLKEAFPETSILIVSSGDRAYKNAEGQLVTMPGIISLVSYQEALAAEAGVAFWNLFEAMGGAGGIVKLTKERPAEANLDYTHINFRGGKRLSKLLFDALIYGEEQYQKRRNYEEQ